MRDIMSCGLVLCASNEDHTKVEPLIPPKGAKIGERVSFAGDAVKFKDLVVPLSFTREYSLYIMMVEADLLVKGKIDNLISQSSCVAISNNKTVKVKVKEESNVREGKENELMSIVSALLSLKTMGEVHKDELEQKSKAKKRKKTMLVSSISSKNDESCPGSNTGNVSIKRSPHCRSSWVNKTIRMPATNLKGADKFSWRSNGTKQLVGLSHLRRYYRCSNKECSVHKIVDQDPNDPSMLIVNYNGEHNHTI